MGKSEMIYHFNNVSLDTNLYQVNNADSPVDVEPKVFDLLVYLIEHRGRVVPREELLNSVWQGRVVSDTALSACLKAARKAIGDSGRRQNVIKTLHARGYQFVAPVSQSGQADAVRSHPSRRGVKPSIRIGAFRCLQEDEEAQTLAEELHDQILLRLSHRTGIRVMEAPAAQEESQRSSSDYVLSGRIRRIASEYRVNLSTVWSATEETVWAEGFTGDAPDLLAFAEEITNTVDAALRVELNAYDARRLADRDESQLNAAELLTKAAEYTYKVSIDDLRHGLALIDRALAIDPDDAMALAMRVGGGVMLACTVPDDMHDEDDAALSGMAHRSIELNPRSDYAFVARGSLRLLRLNNAHGALEDANRCLDMSPSYVDGLELMGSTLICLEQCDKAIEVLERAVALSKNDPFHAYILERLATARFLSGNLEGALADIDSALQLHSGVWTYHRLKAAILARQGREAAARESVGRVESLIGSPHILAVELPLPPAYKQLLESAAPVRTESKK